MKKKLKKLSALLMALAVSTCLVTTASAAADDPMMIIHGKMETEDSVEWVNTYLEDDGDYTQTDLFAGLKNVMPGDTLEQTIYIKNGWTAKDYIRLSMIAVLHDEEGNPISESVLEELEADDRNEMESELAYMHDFLHQLTLTVKAGDKVIYQGHPDELATGFEEGVAYSFGRVRDGDTVQLDVTLSVPIELGNEYANRIGEVDWKFVWSGHNNSKPEDPVIPENPDDPDDPVIPPVDIEDPDVPLTPPDEPTDPDTPKTGDDTMIWPYIILLMIGLAGMVLTAGKKKQTRE